MWRAPWARSNSGIDLLTGARRVAIVNTYSTVAAIRVQIFLRSHMSSYHRPTALVVIAIVAIGFLYLPTLLQSSGDMTGWAWNELHVDYAGGFVRRGLLGEIAYQLHQQLGISTKVFFGFLFLTLTATQAVLLAALASPLAGRWPAIFLLTMLSPALLLFAAYDDGGYFRRDLFIALGMLLHALVARGRINGAVSAARYDGFVLLGVAPYVLLATMIHENQILFIPLHMALVALASGGWRASRPTTRNLGVLATIAVACAGLVVVYRGNAATAESICQSWQGLAAPLDCNPIRALGWNFSNLVELDLRILHKPISILLYLTSFLLALLPTLAIREAQRLDGHTPLPWRLLALVIAPQVILFAFGWDWGRWINLIGLSSICLFLAVQPTSHHAPTHVSRTGGFFMVALALVYIPTWKLNHCCDISSLSGGFFETSLRSIRLTLGL
ncbi:MAG: hypothetical protein ABI439_00505 [Rhodospirillales bacterium]